jgi:hypothetical protein
MNGPFLRLLGISAPFRAVAARHGEGWASLARIDEEA